MDIQSLVHKLNQDCERRFDEKRFRWIKENFYIEAGKLCCDNMICYAYTYGKQRIDVRGICDTCKFTIQSYQIDFEQRSIEKVYNEDVQLKQLKMPSY